MVFNQLTDQSTVVLRLGPGRLGGGSFEPFRSAKVACGGAVFPLGSFPGPGGSRVVEDAAAVVAAAGGSPLIRCRNAPLKIAARRLSQAHPGVAEDPACCVEERSPASAGALAGGWATSLPLLGGGIFRTAFRLPRSASM